MSINQEPTSSPMPFGVGEKKRPSEGSTVMYDVTMSTYKKLDIPNNDLKTHVLKTVGVNGCDAILVWKVDPETGDEILLTHYPPTEVELHRRVLKDFSPRGKGIIKVVYLTMGKNESEWVTKLSGDVEQILGTKQKLFLLQDYQQKV